MDWNAAIERNREALKRILAMLVAMAGARPGRRTPAHPAAPSPPRDTRACCVRPKRPRGGWSSWPRVIWS